MVKPKSFEEVINSLRERKKFERDNEKKSIEAKCSHCKGNICSNGRSKISGICNNCIKFSLNND